MKKLLIGFLVVVFLVGVFGQVAKAAEWKFHFNKAGWLKVHGTIDCKPKDMLYWMHGTKCDTARGSLPAKYNDFRTIFQWAPFYSCENVDTSKVFVLRYEDGRWKLVPLAAWIETNVPDYVILPTIGDSTGVIRYVHVAVNLEEWLADPRPLQETYDITDGECDDLPGYLIGTTPITFDSLAGPGENPFQTTPLTGTLVRDGEIIFTPIVSPIPTLTEWGLIIFGVVLLGFITWVFIRRRKAIGVRV